VAAAPVRDPMATVEIRCEGYAGRKDHRVTPPVRPIRDGEVVVAEPGIALEPRRDSDKPGAELLLSEPQKRADDPPPARETWRIAGSSDRVGGAR
jgi:hypothetical protein